MTMASLMIMARTAAARSSTTSSKLLQPLHHHHNNNNAIKTVSMIRSLSSIPEEKKAQKELRRQRYQAKQEKLAKLATRRSDRPTNVKKQHFSEWYDKRRTYHEIMDRKARQAGLDWKIAVAVVVERLPVVTPDVEDWEQEYLELRAYLDQFDWEYPKELGMNKEVEEDLDDDDEALAPPPRETEADASGDYQTLERRLKTRIYYAQKETNDAMWTFPTSLVQENETLLQAAERVASATFGDSTTLLSLSNSPMAVDLEVDKATTDGFYGTKTFFMKLQYLDGPATVTFTDPMVDHGWLERSELAERARAAEGPNAAKFHRYML